jgi:protein-S-isoprenylcysteine O-methyltransferase Ste14
MSKSITSILVRNHSLPSFAFTAPSLALITGSFLSIMGTAIRHHCYRTLGRLFTFELSIRQGHKLVTSGPYSIIRHPSYTGGLCVYLSILLCHLYPQSWLVSCSGIFPSSDQAAKLTLACIWVTFSSILYSGLGGRVQKEEVMLEEHFGDQWRSYRKKVPYRLVPWLY